MRPLVKFQRFDKDLPLPKYESLGAAGVDLCAAYDGVVVPGQVKFIRTGIAVQIPEGWEGQIRPRSGLAGRYGVTVVNSPGTIDSDYRGELVVMLICLETDGKYDYRKGDRIAQLVFCPVAQAEIIEVDELDGTERGAGGFGSTGI